MPDSRHAGQATAAASPAPLPDEGDRRGRRVPYVSYWSAKERQRRAAIFTAREQGLSVRAIASSLDVDVHEVEAVLLSDRRRRRTTC